MNGFPERTCAFLADLARNNDRAWFDAYKARYQTGLNCWQGCRWLFSQAVAGSTRSGST